LFLLQPTNAHTYTPDQQTNNIKRGLYMQPQIHTASTRDYIVRQILLYR